jgi:hypothetical protein
VYGYSSPAGRLHRLHRPGREGAARFFYLL